MEKTYKGHTYTRTKTTTTVRYQRGDAWLERIMPVYDIKGLKPAAQRPFLTTERQVRDYIDARVEGLPPMRGDAPQRITTARSRAGMTQQELGEQLGYAGATAQVTVGRWEAGTRPVPMSKIKALAEVLGIDPVKLLP